MLNVLAPTCYLGIDDRTPLGRMVDTAFNLTFATVNGITSQEINISCSNPWFLTAIYIISITDTILIKPYDDDGNEIFTDFFLTSQTGNSTSTDPFVLLPPRPFRPNGLLRFDVLDALGGGVSAEVIFRGYELIPSPRGVNAPGNGGVR